MKYSGIGGQAVIEGVMMKAKDEYAVAVRKPDREITVETKKYHGPSANPVVSHIPIVRGICSFVESLYLGMSTLTFSASFFDEEEVKKKEALAALPPEERAKREKQEKRKENAVLGGTVFFSLILAIVIFFVVPYFLSGLFRKVVDSFVLQALFEGVLRLAIFIGYILLISRMEDIRRVFMYHGAEHKCINCIEHGLELTVENVRKSSRQHKRCGTSFLLIVMVISIVFFMFIRVDQPLLRLGLRILLVPLIAGVSYEFIRFAGRHDNLLVDLISKPGLLLQGLTTREPEDDMIEVGIASVEAVFDWREWQKENGL